MMGGAGLFFNSMNQDIFWQIIETACRSDPHSVEEWNQRLVDELTKLLAAEIIEWNHIFDRMVAAAYTSDLIGVCVEINGGAGDDGFYYFRCWLVGMGKKIYSLAIVSPDSLADVVSPEWCQIADAESGIYWVAHEAWMQVTGNPDDAHYPARNEYAELIGEFWDPEDPELMRQHLPRLFELYNPNSPRQLSIFDTSPQ
jgi:Protein of unknown function (DUF4240)